MFLSEFEGFETKTIDGIDYLVIAEHRGALILAKISDIELGINPLPVYLTRS